ncbi:MAG TPA: 3-phosphoglycerate dehydrogenase [Ruminococcus sp.]|nr:3-phosphoglycerate dehydrogenase [Ruminococcus sp.]HBN11096.1 3-phosphoglycerate dehydrogenase [Ruminococcus sp.]
MYNIQTLNKIAACGTDIFNKDIYAVADSFENPDAIMVRSAAMHDMAFGSNLLAIARAGAGVNNIPVDKCAEMGICVFNTPGANANAVKELVIAGLLLASRNIAGAMDWVKTLKGDENAPKAVEKGKSQFVGPEIQGKTLGIIGLGAIGCLVANAALAIGMKVVGVDPFMSVNAALRLNPAVKVVNSNDAVYAEADYISIHVPCNADTKGFVNAEAIAKMKDGVRILNFARGELVNDADIIAAIENKKVARYVTDFPNANTIGVDGIVAIPHLGASTPESEDNCAVMAANELIDYIENGNITNSVNLPNASMNATGKKVCIIHKNVPSIISQITAIFGNNGVNIENMLNKSKKDYAYTMIDAQCDAVSDSVISEINAVDGVIKVRVI